MRERVDGAVSVGEETQTKIYEGKEFFQVGSGDRRMVKKVGGVVWRRMSRKSDTSVSGRAEVSFKPGVNVQGKKSVTRDGSSWGLNVERGRTCELVRKKNPTLLDEVNWGGGGRGCLPNQNEIRKRREEVG